VHRTIAIVYKSLHPEGLAPKARELPTTRASRNRQTHWTTFLHDPRFAQFFSKYEKLAVITGYTVYRRR